MKFKIVFPAVMALLSCACTTSNQSPDKGDSDTSDFVQTETQASDDSSKIYVLKWKSVSSSEWGNSYDFIDESGNDFHADRVSIDGFDEDNNEYFTRTPVEGTPFSQYEIKEAAKEKWFDIRVITTQEENDTAGDGSIKDVVIIVGIKPH